MVPVALPVLSGNHGHSLLLQAVVGGWSVGPGCGGFSPQSDLLHRGRCVMALSAMVGISPYGAAVLPHSAMIHHRCCRYAPLYLKLHAKDLTKQLWDWKTGSWSYYWSKGRIERQMRGETRKPILEKPIIAFDTPQVERFFEMGMKVKDENLQMKFCRASLVFHLSAPPKDNVNILMALVDPQT